MDEKIGKITHFFGHISVAVLLLTDGDLKVGDTIHIKGAHTDFQQKITSMQINKQDIEVAKKGDDIGLKVNETVHVNDEVYKIVE